MKKLFVLMAVLLIGFTSCDFSGPAGPAGSNGTTGTPGAGGTLFISTDTTWSTDQDLKYSVFIEENAVLTILPGIKIKTYPNFNITGYGKIVAIGNSANKILFYGSSFQEGGGISIYTKHSSITNIFLIVCLKTS